MHDRQKTIFLAEKNAQAWCWAVIAAVLLLVAPAALIAQSVDVPADYWGYRFLERAETNGWFSSLAMRTQPISRRDFAAILAQIQQHHARHHSLSTSDERLLNQLLIDFHDEQPQTGKESGRERHFLRVEEENGQLYLDLLAKQSLIINRGGQYDPDQLLSETMIGGILRGHLGNALGVYADARNALTRGNVEVQDEDENFDTSQGSPVVVSGPNIFQDRAVAYLIWEKPWLRIKAGQDALRWGPGQHGHLAVSSNMPPATQIALSTRFKRFQFNSVHAFLQSSLGAKYLAGHRVDFCLSNNLYIGAAETVIYGNRDIELAYLNPLMLYHIAEHHLGDHDNNSLSIDFTLFARPGVRLYGEWFIDDMTSTEPLLRFYGNKFAFLLGGMLSAPLGVQNLDLTCEYARIEPFVYSHYDSINIYTHYDKIIGHWLGPNADSWYVCAGYQVGRDFRLEAFLERQRKGPGQADTVSQPESGTRKHFLHGTVENKQIAGFKATEQVRRDIFLALGYSAVWTDNAQRQAGWNTTDHLVRFELMLNY